MWLYLTKLCLNIFLKKNVAETKFLFRRKMILYNGLQLKLITNLELTQKKSY